MLHLGLGYYRRYYCHLFVSQSQGCPQAIAHSDCAIYSNKLRYQIIYFFQIIVELQSFECNMHYLLTKISVMHYLLSENSYLL